jgi:hypothetical protein
VYLDSSVYCSDIENSATKTTTSPTAHPSISVVDSIKREVKGTLIKPNDNFDTAHGADP